MGTFLGLDHSECTFSLQGHIREHCILLLAVKTKANIAT